MKNIAKNLISSFFAFLLFCAIANTATAQDYKKQARKETKSVEQNDALAKKAMLKRIADSKKKTSKVSLKPTKAKKGQHTVEGLKAIKSGNPVIQYKRTGNPTKDKAAYLAAKKRWIAENPELYKKLISKKK